MKQAPVSAKPFQQTEVSRDAGSDYHLEILEAEAKEEVLGAVQEEGLEAEGPLLP